MLNKINILLRCLWGYVLRFAYWCRLLNVPSLGSRPTADVIISLTSYGRRVSDNVVYYTLCSILRQTRQPKRVILWLSHDEWNEQTIPDKLRKLQPKGIEIRYVEDMLSYKKLFPALAEYSNENIMTIDDDILYPSNLVKNVWEEHLKSPEAIVAPLMRQPEKNEDGEWKTYRDWKHIKGPKEGKDLFPIGVSGILYPRGSLEMSMANYSIAKNYAPYADDVWFWAMGRNTMKIKTAWSYPIISYDALYQYFHQGSALMQSNMKAKGKRPTNDMQIENVLKYIQNNE